MARQKPLFGPQLHRAWRTRIRRCLERGQWRLSLRLLGCLTLKNEAGRTGGRRPRSLGGGNRGPAWHVGAAPAAVIYGDLRSASDRMGCVRRGRWAKRGRKTEGER